MSGSDDHDVLRIEALFHEVMELDAEAREARLAEADASDPQVAARVRTLLHASEHSDEFFAALPAQLVNADPERELPDLVGRRVGPYELETLIGRGGMGAVYRARRADQHYEMSVAVKLVPVGIFSEASRQRFRLERQTLARLDHPNIARLLDGGVLEDGTPYLVMDLVEGLPIDQWCDTRALRVRERIEKFLVVLDAVQHAHRGLVLHHDLKPDNVLVSDRGEVKLIDFGIARSIDDDASESTQTRRASPLTPGYASPEQLLGRSLTTASDVYALGVMLYVLLTGQRPYEVSGRSLSEIERAVLQGAAVPPSRRRGAHDAAGLRGDLDTIVLKAMHKDPARRYASPEAMADDLRRHLAGQAIAARSDSASYVLGRLVNRHRWPVAAVVGTVVLVIGFAFTLAAMASRHAREVGRERDTAEAVAGFLATLYDGADPELAQGREISAREMLDQSALRLQADMAGQPEVLARMSSIMAALYVKLNDFDRAMALVRQADSVRSTLADGDPFEHAADLERMAGLFQRLERFNSADSVLDVAERMRRSHARDSSGIAPVMLARGELEHDREQAGKADSLLELAYRYYRLTAHPDSLALARVLTARGAVALDWHSLATAESLYAEATRLHRLAGGASKSAGSEAERGQVRVLLRLEHFAEAESLLRVLRGRVDRWFPPDHELAIHYATLHGHALSGLGRSHEARGALQHALNSAERRFGVQHQLPLGIANLLGLTWRDVGAYDSALVYLRRSAVGHRALGGERAVAADIVEANIANTLIEAGRLDEAAVICTRLRANLLANPNQSERRLLTNAYAFARIRHQRGALASAESTYRRVLIRFREASTGRPSSEVAGVLVQLGRLLLDSNRSDEATTVLREAVDIAGVTRPIDHPSALRSRAQLARALWSSGRKAEADTMLARARAALHDRLGPGHPFTREADGITARMGSPRNTR